MELDTLTPEEWHLWHVWMQAQRLLAHEIERRLQDSLGISKADFSVLVSLYRSARPEIRVSDLAAALLWEKSRVAHQLTRMENRGLVKRVETGAAGRRTGLRLTAEGRRIAKAAVLQHAGNVKDCFFDHVSGAQSAAILDWSEQMIARLQTVTGVPGDA